MASLAILAAIPKGGLVMLGHMSLCLSPDTYLMKPGLFATIGFLNESDSLANVAMLREFS